VSFKPMIKLSILFDERGLASGEMEILGLFRMEEEAQCPRGHETIRLHMRVVQ
jgi:hypothetical protein